MPVQTSTTITKFKVVQGGVVTVFVVDPGTPTVSIFTDAEGRRTGYQFRGKILNDPDGYGIVTIDCAPGSGSVVVAI